MPSQLAPALHIALEAFDGCPNKKLSKSLSGSFARAISVECAKYPEQVLFTGSADKFSRDTNRAISALEFGCNGCPFSKEEPGVQRRRNLVDTLHPHILNFCGELFIKKHYAQASLTSYIVVKERLRELTNYENATEAVGKGGLTFIGAAGEHVDGMYQQSAKFVLMAIDTLRNEASHSIAPVLDETTDEKRSFMKMSLSSLGMVYLDNIEIRS